MGSVAVIGGGPAAGAAALHLARAGVPVTLYAPPRRGEKPCGGGLPEHLLDDLEGFDATSLASVAVRSARFENGDGGRLDLDLCGLRVFRRGDLDPALTAAAVAAGARRVRAKAAAVAWEWGRPVVVAAGERRAHDWLLAADGARSVVLRALLRDGVGECQPRGESVGLGASLASASIGGGGERMVLGFPGAADAYGWIFPRPGGVSVGLAYSPALLSHGAAQGLLAAFLGRHLPAALPLARRYRYPIPVYGPWTLPRSRRALARRVLLTGDAAAVADPLTREGIRPAVLSGRWAAAALAAGRPEEYAERLGDGLDAEMGRARRAAVLFYDDGLAHWMVPVCRLHPGVRTVLQDLLACRRPYRGLRRRLLAAALSPAA